jgi:beta-galactosidase/beta-glucuronidase
MEAREISPDCGVGAKRALSPGAFGPEARLSPAQLAAADAGHDAMVGALEAHPSVALWTVFNEAWGQHRTAEVTHPHPPLTHRSRR